MPAAKRGTVTEDVVAAIREAQGMLDWKGNKFGYVRAAVGRVSHLNAGQVLGPERPVQIHFPVSDVENNVRTFLQTVREAMTPEDEAFATRKKAGAFVVLLRLVLI